MKSIKTEYTNKIVYHNEQGDYHRIDGPAIERNDGYKSWFINGERHRLDGPAIEWDNGTKEWFINGERHREDGPAREFTNGYKEWWLNGIEYFENIWEQEVAKIKLKRILDL
jgi:hypothetical protein